jgi:hypothetical protein
MISFERVHPHRLSPAVKQKGDVLPFRIDCISSLPHEREEIIEGRWLPAERGVGVDGGAKFVLKGNNR